MTGVRVLIHWKPEKGCVNDVQSDEIIFITVARQECVLSPQLFSFYVNDMRLQDRNVKLLRCADDTVIVCLYHMNNYLLRYVRRKNDASPVYG